MGDWIDCGVTEIVEQLGIEPGRGASVETLRRRVAYGGRKGRRAARRLRRNPPIRMGWRTWMTVRTGEGSEE